MVRPMYFFTFDWKFAYSGYYDISEYCPSFIYLYTITW